MTYLNQIRIVFLYSFLFSSLLTYGQVTETFEDETTGASTFSTVGGAAFNLTSPMEIGFFPNGGTNGTGDSLFLESNLSQVVTVPYQTVGSFSIQGMTNAFIINKFDGYLSADADATINGTVRFIGTPFGGGAAITEDIAVSYTGLGSYDWAQDLAFTGSLQGVELISLEVQIPMGTNYWAIDDLEYVVTDPTIPSVVINDVTMPEGDSGNTAYAFTVSRTNNLTAFDVTVATANNTANAGVDYSAVGPTVLSFTVGGSLSQTVMVNVIGDQDPEPNESFYVNLSNPTNGALIIDNQGVGTILDDDLICETFEDENVQQQTFFSEAGIDFLLTDFLRIDSFPAGNGGNGPSDWYADTGPNAVSGSVGQIKLNTPGKVFQIESLAFWTSNNLGDNTTTGDVTIIGYKSDNTQVTEVISIVPPDGNSWVVESFAGTMLDGIDLDSIEFVLGSGLNYLAIDDFKFAEYDNNITTVSLSDAVMFEGDAGTTNFTFSVIRSDNLSAFSVDVTSFDATATIADMDYVPISPNPTTLNFSSGGALSQTIDIVVNGDPDSEINEEFILSLSNATNGVIITNGTGVGTILDDDTACETFESAVARGETTFNEGGLMFMSTGDLLVSTYYNSGGGGQGSDWYLESDSTMVPHSGSVGEIQITSPGSLFKILRLDLWTSNNADENTMEPDSVRFIGKIFGGGTDTVDILTSGTNWNENISFAGTNLDGVGLTALEVVLIGNTNYVAIDNFCYEPASALSTCPTIGSVTPSNMDVCVNFAFDVMAMGLMDMAMISNGEQDFGIEFVIFSSVPLDPYTGGQSLGVVPFNDLTSSNTSALISGISVSASGTYQLYARLSPAPIASFCRPVASSSLTVNNLPNVTYTAPADLCIDAGVQIGLGGGTTTGGVYSGPGVTDDGNGMTYSFDPAAAGVGVHSITYDYTDVNGCSSSASDEVEVFPLPMVNFTAPADLCLDAGVQAGLGGGTPTGGVYSGAGVTDDGNGMTYSFDPAVAGVGVHTISYDYTDGNGCSSSASDDVEVFALPVVSFTAPADLCVDAGVQTGLSGGTPTGGVYSGPGVTDDGNGMTYSFDPAVAGVGVHTIMYNFTSNDGCSGVAMDDIEVFDLPTVTLATAPGYCLDAPIQTAPITGGSPSGGVYSGVGVTDNGNGTSYNLDPTVNGVGTVTVTYTYTDVNGCTNSAMSDIEIYGCTPDISDPCSCLDNATPYDIDNNTGGDDGQFSELVSVTGGMGTPLPMGQTWTVVGGTGAFDANNVPALGTKSVGVPVATDGSVTLSYNMGAYELPFVHIDDEGYMIMVEGPFPMGSAANVTLSISNKCVYPDPEFDPVIEDIILDTDPVITLGGTDTNGGMADNTTFTIDGTSATTLDPGSLTLGSHTVVMIYDGADDGNGGVSPDGGTTSASPGCIQEVEKAFEIRDCELKVDCSSITDQTLACRADLPPVDFALPMVLDSCGEVTLSALTIIPGDTGCPGDTLFIPRTYFIQDVMGNMEECMQTFTIISTMDPTFTSFPNDTVISCDTPTDPSATGMAEGVGECDPASPVATVSFSDAVTAGMSPQEMRITRTWTVTDRCGRATSMDQMIMVIDTVMPEISCPMSETVVLEAGECGLLYEYMVSATDNCDAMPTISMLEGIASGEEIPHSTTQVFMYEARDRSDNADTCTWEVTVEEFPVASESLVCNSNLNISLGIDCKLDLSAGAILEGDYGCLEDFTYMVNGVEQSVITEEGIYSIMVIDPETGNACNSQITVEDKLGPVIACPDDFTVSCSLGIDTSITGSPTILFGGCESEPEIQYYDVVQKNSCDSLYEKVIRRTFYAVDNKGRVSPTCDQLIYVERGALAAIVYPQHWDGILVHPGLNDNGVGSVAALECDEAGVVWNTIINEDGIEVPSPYDDGSLQGTGYPTLGGTHTCSNIVMYYDDKILNICDQDCGSSSYKILRTWNVIEWCSGTVALHEQMIVVSDSTAPVIESIPTPDPYSVNPWSCTIERLELPEPVVTENCSGDNVKITIIPPLGIEVENGVALNVFKGMYDFIYYAEDCCGNISEPDTVTITIIDEVKPTAIAKEFTVISLVPADPGNFDETAVAKLFATSLDNGSYDKCGPVKVLIRRDADAGCRIDGNTTYDDDPDDAKDQGEYVEFCCKDATARINDVDGDGTLDVGYHKVWLRVWDDADMNAIYGTEGDNYNETWGYVKVEDPTPPEIIVEDVELFCHDPYEFVDNERAIQRYVSDRDLVYVVSGCENNGSVNNVEGPFFMKGGATSLNPNGEAGIDPDPSIFGIDNDRWAPFDYTCNYGYGWMRYTASTLKGGIDVAYQLITVKYKDDFSCESVIWPDAHVETVCTDIPMDALDYTTGPCELVGWTVDSDTFYFETESCMKIVNEYTVIDWCVNEVYKSEDKLRQWTFYSLWNNGVDFDTQQGVMLAPINSSYQNCTADPDDDYNHRSGVYRFYQTIKVIDTIAPVLASTEDWYFPVVNEDCNAEITVSNSATDASDCQPTSFRWELQLDYNHDGIIDEAIRTEGIDVSFTLDEPLSGPMDSISARWKVWDGCGNVDLAPFTIYTIDEKAPIPYCVDLSSALMEDPNPEDDIDEGMVELWAADFDRGSYDYCYDVLYFTFDNIPFGGSGVDEEGDALPGSTEYIDVMHYYSADTDGDGRSQYLGTYTTPNVGVRGAYLSGDPYNGVEVFLWIPAGKGESVLGEPSEKYTAGRVYTCADYPATEVLMSVWDGKFNYDYCTVDLRLEGTNMCGGGQLATIGGSIRTEADASINEVEIELAEMINTENHRTLMTGNDGSYAFASTPMYRNYSLTPKSNKDPMNGVSTLDLVMLQRHILGIAEFDNPYDYIAGDINGDEKLTATDLIVLRKSILGVYDGFPDNDSWRFVNSNQIPDMPAVWPFTEARDLYYVDKSMMSEDFIGVKIGDVNGNVEANSRDQHTGFRSSKRINLYIKDKEVTPGESVTVSFAYSDDKMLYGYQFTMELGGLEYSGLGLQPAGLQAEHVAVFDKYLTVSHNDQDGMTTGELFSMTFTVEKQGWLSKMISFSDRKISSEAYSGPDLEIIKMELVIEGEADLIYNLHQNEPNPFSEITSIGFELPEEGKVLIRIRDVAGKEVLRRQKSFSEGSHTMSIDRTELGTSGVYYYTLSSGNFSETKKMILID